MSATPAWQLPVPRPAAASVIAMVAWPRPDWARRSLLPAAGPMTAVAAAEPATCPAPRQAFASSRSYARSVTRMKSHGCQFCEDGDRRPASRIWSRTAAGIGRSAKSRTLRRDTMASHASPAYRYETRISKDFGDPVVYTRAHTPLCEVRHGRHRHLAATLVTEGTRDQRDARFLYELPK